MPFFCSFRWIFLLFVLTPLLQGPVTAQEYGYGPDDPSLMMPHSAPPAPQDFEKKGIGFGTVRGGTLLQLELTSFSLSEIEGEVGQAVALLDADTTYGFMGTIGGIGRRGLGFDVSAGYYKSDFSESIDGFAGIDATVNAELVVVPMFANLRFQLGLTESFAIEAGAGLGGAYASATGSASTSAGDFSTTADGLAGGWQGMLGLSYALGSNVDLSFAYRYMVFPTVEDLRAQSVGLGLRVRF
jgi:opacity protein-like surface antigen